MDSDTEFKRREIEFRMDEFRRWLMAEEEYRAEQIDAKLKRLKASFWKDQFGEDLPDTDYKEKDPFAYELFWIEPEEGDAAQKRKNLADLFKTYVRLIPDIDEDDVLDVKTADMAAPDAPSVITDEEEHIAPGVHPAPERAADVAKPLPPKIKYHFNPSYVRSSGYAGAAGFVTGFAISALMGSTSRIAICAAAAGVGAPFIPTIMAGGFVAGAVSGSVRSLWKNRHEIADSVSDARGRGKIGIGAAFNAVGRSLSMKQIFLNGVMGAAGAVGGGIVAGGLENVLDNISCVQDWMNGTAAVPAGGATSLLPDISPDATIAPVADAVPDAPSQTVADIPEQATTTPAEEFCPKYITGCEGNEDLAVAGAGTPEVLGQPVTASIAAEPTLAPEVAPTPDPVIEEPAMEDAAAPVESSGVLTSAGSVIDFDTLSQDAASLHTVVRGDNIWTLGGGTQERMEQIIAANAERYPQLLTNPWHIEPDWKLVIPAEDSVEAANCNMVRVNGRLSPACTLDLAA